MYTKKNSLMSSTLAVWLLCLVAAFQVNAAETDVVMQYLDNVPREFPIKALKQVASFPAASDVKGRVIGVINQNQEIESLDETTIHALARPAVERLVAKHMPAYSNFKVDKAHFMLFKTGELVLALTISQGNLPAQTVYVDAAMADQQIVMPPDVQAASCDRRKGCDSGDCVIVKGVIGEFCACTDPFDKDWECKFWRY